MADGWGQNGWDEKRSAWAKYEVADERGRPRNKLRMFDIISRIQNAYAWEKKVIESELEEQDIKQFEFNFRMSELIQWFGYAFKSGFGEVFIFFLLFPFFLLAQFDIIKFFPGVSNRQIISIYSFVFLFAFNLGMTILYLYISKFVIGPLTRRMFSAIAWGRAIPLFLKAVFFLVLSFYISTEYIKPEWVYWLSKYLKYIADKSLTQEDIYYKIMENIPLIKRDFQVSAAILTSFAILPVFFIRARKNIKFGARAWIEAVSKIKCKLNLSGLKDKKIHVGCGLSIYPNLPSNEFEKEIKPVFQTDAERSTHTDIIGTTGVGKTRFAESLIEQDILLGNSVIVIDPKTDWDLFSRVWSAAVEANRTEDFIFISLLHPHLSSGINPLRYYTYPDEVISTIVSTIQAKEEFFVNIAKEMATLIVQGLAFLAAQEEGVRKIFTYSEILRYISQDGLREIRNRLEAYKDVEPAKVQALIENYNQAIKSPPDYFNKVVSTLRTNVANFSHGIIGRIIGKADDNRVIERLESGKRVICYVMTGSQTFKASANQLSRVLLAMIDNLAGRLNASGKKLAAPLRIHIDEAYTAMYHGIEHLFDKGRSTGIGLIMYHQSIGQFYEAVGEKLTKTIIDNINTFFIMRVKEKDTQEFAERMTGKRLTALPTYSTDGHAGFFPDESFRIPAERFADFPQRVGLFVRDNALDENYSRRVYILKTPDIKPPKIQVVPEDLRAVDNKEVEARVIDILKRFV